MKILKPLSWLCYRVWFYVLVCLSTFVMAPFLLLSVSKTSWYPLFFKVARVWSKIILAGMGFYYHITSTHVLERGKNYVFIANHTSMVDIMLMFVAVKNPFVFVGKKELAKIPLFGFFYRQTCILVDRSSPQSRRASFFKAKKRLEAGLSICIFPEGGVPEAHVLLDRFKDGAFKLAINHHIPIVPLTFPDNKKRFSYQFFSGSPGRMRVKIHEPIYTEQLTSEDTKALNRSARAVILNQLNAFKC